MNRKITLSILVLIILLAGVGYAQVSNEGVTAMTATTATISWNTVAASSSQVIFGLTSNLSSPSVTPIIPNLVTSHSATITGITGIPQYTPIYYQAKSVDGSGNIVLGPIQNFVLCVPSTGGNTGLSGTDLLYYVYGGYSITWVNQSGQAISPTVCGSPVTTTVTGSLDGAASLNITIPDVRQIVPSPSQWQVTVNSVGSIGAYTLSPLTVTGPSFNISSQLQAGANGHTIFVWFDQFTGIFFPPITGTGTVTSVGFGAPNGFTVTGSPITGGGTLAFAMPPGWATGSLLVGNGANSVTNLPLGTNGQCLQANNITLIYGACGTSANFQTNGVPNSSQTVLNLTAGTGITLTPGSSGLVTITGTNALVWSLLSPIPGTPTVPAYSFAAEPDLGVYANSTQTFSLSVTGASASSGTATLTVSQTVRSSIGQSILVAGVGGTGFNGTFQVTGTTSNTVSYACPSCTSAGSGGTVTPYMLGLGGFGAVFNRLHSSTTNAASFGSIQLGPQDSITYGCNACSNSTVTGQNTTDQNLISGNSSNGGVKVGDYQGAQFAGPINVNSALYVATTIPGAAITPPSQVPNPQNAFGISNDGAFYTCNASTCAKLATAGTSPVLSVFGGLTGAVGNLVGDVTTSGTLTTTIASIQGTLVTGTTGVASSAVVLANTPSITSPTLTTPTMAGAYADLNTTPLTFEAANSSTGTTINLLAKFVVTSGSLQVQTTATTDSSGYAGICISGCGAAGNAKLAREGKVAAQFDGSTTSGNYAVNSPSVAGKLHDSGVFPPNCPTSQQPVGRIETTNAGGGLYNVYLSGPDVQCSANLPSAAGGTVLANNTIISGTASFLATPVLGIPASISGTLGLANGNASGTIFTLGNSTYTTTLTQDVVDFGYNITGFGAQLNGTGVSGVGHDDAPNALLCLAAYNHCNIPATQRGATTHLRWASPQFLPGGPDASRRLSCTGSNNDDFTSDNTGSVVIDIDMPGGTSGPGLWYGGTANGPFNGITIDKSCAVHDIATYGHPGTIAVAGNTVTGTGTAFTSSMIGSLLKCTGAGGCGATQGYIATVTSSTSLTVQGGLAASGGGNTYSIGPNSPGFLGMINVSNTYTDMAGGNFGLGGMGANAVTLPTAANAISCSTTGGSISSGSFPLWETMQAIGPNWAPAPAPAAIQVTGAQAGCTASSNCSCAPKVPAAIALNATGVFVFWGQSSTNTFQIGMPYLCSAGGCSNTSGVLNTIFNYAQATSASNVVTTLPTSGNGPDALDHSPGYISYGQGTAAWNCLTNSSVNCGNGFSNQLHFRSFNAENTAVALDFDNKVAAAMVTDCHINLSQNGVSAIVSESGILVSGCHFEGGTASAGPMAVIGGPSPTLLVNDFFESGNNITGLKGINMFNSQCVGCAFGNSLQIAFDDSDPGSHNNLFVGAPATGSIIPSPSDIIIETTGRYSTVPNLRYHTTSAATNASIGTTSMMTSITSNPGGNQTITGTRYIIGAYVLQTGLGVTCSGSTGIAVNAIFTDPNASSTSTINFANFTISGNGTLNAAVPPTTSGSGATLVVSNTGGYMFPAKPNTLISYSTTVTPDGTCGTKPTYAVTPILYLGGIL